MANGGRVNGCLLMMKTSGSMGCIGPVGGGGSFGPVRGGAWWDSLGVGI